MLRRFKVSNFKCFDTEYEFDLTQVKRYEFNSGCISQDTINTAIIYGQNGSGKSNLALAIFDLIEHLTDINKSPVNYDNYLCGYSSAEYASFYFEFLINSKAVVYEYKKRDYETLVYERLSIDNKEVVLLDRTNGNIKATISLAGADNLNSNITNEQLSVIKYIKNNTVLAEDDTNKTFTEFMKFVESMLFFRCLDYRMYLGVVKYDSITLSDNLINKGKVSDFEQFLNEAGVECSLCLVDNPMGGKTLAFDFNGKKVDFFSAASTGTNSLLLFYCWYLSIIENKVSFLFIDEFDAFYHNELSALIVRKLKESGIQFVLTSHNLSIMTNDLLRPDCYFSMNKQMIKSFADLTTKELRMAHNIEKMYKAGAFNVE